MNKRLLSVAIAGFLVVGLAGCNMTKQEIGTGIGAVVGGVIGNKLGGSGLATIAGAAVGGLLGNMIGANLDEEDRKELAAKTAQNLETMKTGEVMTWKSDRTGNQADVTVGESKEEKQPVSISTASAITVPANVKLIQKTYQATQNATIYTQASSGASVVGTLSKNKTTNVMGKTEDGKWLLVSRKGVLIGFISADNLKVYTPPVVTAKTTTTTNKTAEATTNKDVKVAETTNKQTTTAMVADLDAMPAKEVTKSTKAAFDLDAIDVKQQQTTASVECKTLTYDIKAKGDTTKETGKACKTASGTWDLG